MHLKAAAPPSLPPSTLNATLLLHRCSTCVFHKMNFLGCEMLPGPHTAGCWLSDQETNANLCFLHDCFLPHFIYARGFKCQESFACLCRCLGSLCCQMGKNVMKRVKRHEMAKVTQCSKTFACQAFLSSKLILLQYISHWCWIFVIVNIELSEELHMWILLCDARSGSPQAGKDRNALTGAIIVIVL